MGRPFMKTAHSLYNRDKIKKSPKGRFNIILPLKQPYSALAGNGNLSGEDQLVNILGNGTDDLHVEPPPWLD